ncbi:hypothetical protein E5676_scaffold374G00300 [Cucumis melo var. makuwa]|uniref:CCHC-type domain-containing protein n=1 Tax=Cucumis melo var. makuwa TaxID=1194695 RepID=A0A5D3BW87_CUCMM|nr:hypothetical protein E6C27_scaffold277G001980 [Cucumis melo var. makuwa]TYK03102.1 hypothetical protein E5676_scaffold374G00300 [Cucumis melo var. makuwa]
MGMKIEQLALRRKWKVSCHHVLEDDAGRIMMGCKVLAREIGRSEGAEPSDPENAYEIERQKKLGATVFEGSTDPTDAEDWLNMLEKCHQDFMSQFGGQALRNMSYGSVFQRQSQRISNQCTRSTVRPQPGQEFVSSAVRQTPHTSSGRNCWDKCLVGAGVCYQCRQPEHFKKDCP